MKYPVWIPYPVAVGRTVLALIGVAVGGSLLGIVLRVIVGVSLPFMFFNLEIFGSIGGLTLITAIITVPAAIIAFIFGGIHWVLSHVSNVPKLNRVPAAFKGIEGWLLFILCALVASWLVLYPKIIDQAVYDIPVNVTETEAKIITFVIFGLMCYYYHSCFLIAQLLDKRRRAKNRRTHRKTLPKAKRQLKNPDQPPAPKRASTDIEKELQRLRQQHRKPK